MKAFEDRLREDGQDGLYCDDLDVVQVNVGLLCNQMCGHCHVKASPHRTEVMDWPVMERIVALAREARCKLVDITGGAPELNPHFRRFVRTLVDESFAVQVRTNLTVHLEPNHEDTGAFLRDHRVRLVASLPCYLESNVDSQRGEGVYAKSIEALRQLNAIGYGIDPALPLNLVYNPVGPALPPEQASLEADYRRELKTRWGVEFTNLLTITNVPIGRFRTALRKLGREQAYLATLRAAFNPATVDQLMCRHQIEVAWDGTLYDCDFNLALRYPVNHGLPRNIRGVSAQDLIRRRIATGDHCFACTAGCGSSCAGALVKDH